jgi:DNA-cytosine methyltransferase
MRPFIDLFCGAGGLTEGFKRAGWMPLCGVDVSYSAVQSYLANHGWSAEGIIGSIEDPEIRQQIVHTYTGRVDAVVGGPPCQGFSDANHNRSEDDSRRSLPSRFIELAADLEPEWIVMEEVPAARGLAARWVAMLRDRGYAAKWAVLSAEKYGVPQRRQRLVMVARKGDEPPANFPPTPTHDVPVSAGEALMSCDASEGSEITGLILEKVMMRAAMTKEQVKAMGYRPRNAYCVMDMGEPAWTLTSCFTNPSGGRFVVGEGGDRYRCLSIKEGAALQSFGPGYHFCGSKTEVKRMIGNAVPPKLAEAVAGGLGDTAGL